MFTVDSIFHHRGRQEPSVGEPPVNGDHEDNSHVQVARQLQLEHPGFPDVFVGNHSIVALQLGKPWLLQEVHTACRYLLALGCNCASSGHAC